MTEEIDVEKIAAASKEYAEKVMSDEERSEAAHKERVLNAAALMEMLNTEGGALLLKNLDELYNGFKFAPEDFLTTLTDSSGVSYTHVDSVMVARLSGAREAIKAVKSIFEQAEHVVKTEALKK